MKAVMLLVHSTLNNMEIVQGIVDAAKEEQSPLILQVSAGARKYAKHIYLVKIG